MTRPAMMFTGMVVLALVARLAAVLSLGDRLHFDDEGVYLDAAVRLGDGMGFGEDFRNVPGYPVVLAALRLAAPDGVLGVRVAQAVLTAAGTAAVMTLALSLGGRRMAFAAGLFYALDPLLVVAGGLLYPEAIAAVVLTLIILAALRAVARDDLRGAALVGALLGGLALLRPVALALVPVLVLWTAAQVTGSWRRRGVHGAVVLLACGAALVPWTYRNYRLHGVVAPIAIAGTHTAPVPLSEIRARGLTHALLQQAREDPGSLAAHAGREFLHFWELYPQRLAIDNPTRRAEIHGGDARLPVEPTFPTVLRDRVSAAASAVEFGLAALGVGVLWGRRRAATVLLLAVMLGFAAGYAPFIGKLRYRIPVVPLLLVLAGAGAASVSDRRATNA